MTTVRRAAAVCCLLAPLFALVATQGRGQTSDKGTSFRVLVPADQKVKVLINGKAVKGRGKGKERTYQAPPLPAGKDAYEITATWATNNYTKFFRSRKVAPKPGETVTVDLRTADPKRPDHIEIRYYPTPADVVARMCKLAKVTKNDIVFDLGCGDGRIVLTAVKEFGAKSGVGVDLDPQRIKESKQSAKEKGVEDRVEFRVADVLKLKDLSKATVVMLYMGDDVNLRLRPILKKTLPAGARVVSHRFTMGDWTPDQTERFTGEDGDEYQIHLWTIRKRADGEK